jgi:outer membrane usher protein
VGARGCCGGITPQPFAFASLAPNPFGTGVRFQEEAARGDSPPPPTGTGPLDDPAPARPAPAAPATSAEPRLNTTNRSMAIVVPLKDGNNYLGDVDIQITPDDSILVSLERLIELVGPRLDTARLSELRATPAEQGFAPFAAFADRGLPLSFDKRTLELSMTVATADRALRTIALSDANPEEIGEFQEPEKFSAYVNVRGAIDYVHKGSVPGLGDPFLLFDGAARFGKIVLESEGDYNGQQSAFRRRGTRLVYDDAKRLARWTAGDLLPETRGFQGAVDIAGLGISRSYALLDPQRNVAPRGGRTFSLDRDSTVEAFVNGRTVRVLRLQPGTYNVSDFPFAQGGNEVELVIVDDTGRRDVISFTTFIERTQLAQGLSEYNLQLGVLSRHLEGVEYSGEPALSGFYRRGLSDNLTVGANFQYADKAYMVGGEAVLGTEWGTIGGDIAISRIPGSGSGWATNFSIERVTQGANGGSSLIATLEARSRRFGAVSQLAADNPYSLNLNLSYSRALGRDSFAGAQFRYAKGRGTFVDEKSARLSVGHRLDRVTNLVVDGEWSKGVRGDDKSFRVSLIRRFGARTSARAEYDSSSDRVRLGVQSSGGYGVGAWSGVANVDGGQGQYNLNLSGNYVANRADIGVAHVTAYSDALKGIADQRTSFRVASAFAYADGAFAVGRPISDGFAIVRSYGGGEDLSIEVEPSQGSYQARSGILGPALFGQVGSYSPRTLTYDVPNASAGLDIGTGSMRMYAPYRAGYVKTVGSDYNVMVIGTLTNDGQPLALQVGYAVETGSDGRRVELFTNRQGRFGVSGLRPGRWRIEMTGTPPIVYELDVPETETGIVRMGELKRADER